MPRKIEWIHRIPEIQARVRRHRVPYLDRSETEKIFGVSPRQAVRILDRLGAETLGGAKVIGRERLLDRLGALEQEQSVVFEKDRWERLHSTLEEARAEARRRNIEIPPAQAVPLKRLPEAIRLEPGRLQVRFSSFVELRHNLMLLTQAISMDWDKFNDHP